MPYSRSLNFFISTICITATKNFVYKNIIDSRAANNTHKEMASKVSKYPMPKIKNQKKKKRNMYQFETKQPLQIHSTETNSHRVQPCVRKPPIQSNIVILIRPLRIGLFQRLGTHVNAIKFYPKSGFRRLTTGSSPRMMIATVNIFVISLVVVLKKKQELILLRNSIKINY